MSGLLLFLGGMIAGAALVIWWARHGSCRHEFTHWVPFKEWQGRPGEQWRRWCVKCEAGEIRHSETESKSTTYYSAACSRRDANKESPV
jgi:hypothetical protein